jgi:hypothetical protein
LVYVSSREDIKHICLQHIIPSWLHVTLVLFSYSECSCSAICVRICDPKYCRESLLVHFCMANENQYTKMLVLESHYLV